MLQCYVAETLQCDVSEMFIAMSRRRYNAMSLNVDIWTYSEYSCDDLAMNWNIHETTQYRSAMYQRCFRDWIVLCGEFLWLYLCFPIVFIWLVFISLFVVLDGLFYFMNVSLLVHIINIYIYTHKRYIYARRN